MRYFLAIFAAVVAIGMLVAGRRGDISRKPPIEVFPDMDRQLKLRPQTPNGFFASGLSSQLPVEGSVAQSRPMIVAGKEIYSFEDHPVNRGMLPGRTNFVELNPLPVTGALLARGHERYNIYCAPCHGKTGEGNGITKKIGAMAIVANLHDKRIVELADGDIFNTLSQGKGQMQGYAPQLVDVQDRWAIVAYVRTLQLSRLGLESDLAPELSAKLKK